MIHWFLFDWKPCSHNAYPVCRGLSWQLEQLMENYWFIKGKTRSHGDVPQTSEWYVQIQDRNGTQREPKSTPYCRSTTTVVHLREGCSVRCTPLAQLLQMYWRCIHNMCTAPHFLLHLSFLKCRVRVHLPFTRGALQEYTSNALVPPLGMLVQYTYYSFELYISIHAACILCTFAIRFVHCLTWWIDVHIIHL